MRVDVIYVSSETPQHMVRRLAHAAAATGPGTPVITSGLVGYYAPDSLDTSVTPAIWRDLSGKNNHASTHRGAPFLGTETRGGKTFDIVRGTTTDGVRFPQIFNRTNPYTLIHVAKYVTDLLLTEVGAVC